MNSPPGHFRAENVLDICHCKSNYLKCLMLNCPSGLRSINTYIKQSVLLQFEANVIECIKEFRRKQAVNLSLHFPRLGIWNVGGSSGLAPMYFQPGMEQIKIFDLRVNLDKAQKFTGMLASNVKIETTLLHHRRSIYMLDYAYVCIYMYLCMLR